jgi:photosystem II stability/assembly factor-like uncharacterized protein
MNKNLLIVFLIIFCSCISKSQELYHVFFTNHEIGYASGFHTSHVYKTTDAGETWGSQSPSLGTGEIGDLFFWSPDSGVALFSDVAKTTNGGLSWQSYPIGDPYWLFGVDFIDSYSGIAVGVNGKIVKTTNGGEEWDLIESGTDIALIDVEYVTSDLILICGDDFSGGGTILRSTNGGLDWSSPPLPISGGFRSISFYDNNIGICTGDQGNILRTIDGGAHWFKMTNPNTYFLFSCHLVFANTAFAVGELGTIIKSTDGQSWSSLRRTLRYLLKFFRALRIFGLMI